MSTTASVLQSIFLRWICCCWYRWWCSSTFFHSNWCSCANIIRKPSSWMTYYWNPINHFYKFHTRLQYIFVQWMFGLRNVCFFGYLSHTIFTWSLFFTFYYFLWVCICSLHTVLWNIKSLCELFHFIHRINAKVIKTEFYSKKIFYVILNCFLS